jgi:hypothetical protein
MYSGKIAVPPGGGGIGVMKNIPGVPELPHDILITYSGVKIKTKF